MNIQDNRFYKIVHGLGRPVDSREYKEARIELERLSAPLVALLLPSLVAAVLLVVTAVGAQPMKDSIDIKVAEPPVEIPDPEPPPPIPDDPSPNNDTEVDISLDGPSVPTPETPALPSPNCDPSPKKPIDSLNSLDVKSPVVFNFPRGWGGRGEGERAKHLGGGSTRGDNATEGAVMKALRWLKIQQRPDGSWPGVPAAATGFAMLAYLAHGEIPSRSREFGDTVQRGLDWLIGNMREKDGVTVMVGSDGNEYAFLIATYALCEAYGMTRNPNAREAAERGLVRIIAGQTATGGWNYKLAKTTTAAPDDISFGGWAMQALKAGRMAGIRPSGMDECLKKAVKCLRTRNYDKQAGFVYRPGSRGGGLGGVGCLCMQLLGQAKSPEVANALEVMRGWRPTFDKKHMSGGGCSQYYSYYATQCKYQAGMPKGAAPADYGAWKKWNVEMKEFYPRNIINDRNADGTPVTVKDWRGVDQPVGHWENQDVHTMRPVMDTCLCALQLMVYYRYQLTTSLKASEVDPDIEAIKETNDIKVRIDI